MFPISLAHCSVKNSFLILFLACGLASLKIPVTLRKIALPFLFHFSHIRLEFVNTMSLSLCLPLIYTCFLFPSVSHVSSRSLPPLVCLSLSFPLFSSLLLFLSTERWSVTDTSHGPVPCVLTSDDDCQCRGQNTFSILRYSILRYRISQDTVLTKHIENVMYYRWASLCHE